MSNLRYGTLRANPKAAPFSSIMIGDAYCECSQKPYCQDVSAPITAPVVGFEYSETLYDFYGKPLEENVVMFETPVDPASPTFFQDLEDAFAFCIRSREFCIRVFGELDADGNPVVNHIGQSEVKWILEDGTVVENTRHCDVKTICTWQLGGVVGTTPDWTIGDTTSPLAFDFAFGDDAAANETVATNGQAALEALIAGIDCAKAAVVVGDSGYDLYVALPSEYLPTVGGKSLVKCGENCVYYTESTDVDGEKRVAAKAEEKKVESTKAEEKK